MTHLVVLLLVIFFTNNFPQTNISPQFSELKGMEDQQSKQNLSFDEILNLYPLAIGNRWVYLIITAVNPYFEYGVKVDEVIGDSIAANGKLYFLVKEDESIYLDRVDSLDGKVYRYKEHPNLSESEYLIVDLMGEVGDSLITFDPVYGGLLYLIVASIDTFYKWGITKFRKNFIQSAYPIFSRFSFTEDIGLDHRVLTYLGYSMYSERTLKGCIINGILYGDTTLTDVLNEEKPITNEFSLSQNFPNPFNPTTKIKFTISDFGFTTLKV
ncbi:MAG TPA: hypothetical protein VLN45_08400 [Ignavibacteriaceae bacterium]|nr:hypothetical protein [Ignavibacteriaceae bacterium]